MYGNVTFKILIAILCFAAFPSMVQAQPLSYVYIQGDKETPFYVKLEDQMQPRFGKNYCIISQLAPGVINIQVLFQQNQYPPQKFTILVPENSYRGFLLTRKGSSFSLYDLQQQFYLPAGNTQADDHAPVSNAFVTKTISIPENKIVTKSITEVQQPVVATREVRNTRNTKEPEMPPVIEYIPDPPAAEENTTTQNKPKFIDDIELTHERPSAYPSAAPKTKPIVNNRVIEQPVYEQPVPAPVKVAPPKPKPAIANDDDDLGNNESANNKYGLMNSDCPSPMSKEDFDELCERVIQKTDKTRLKYLLSKMDNCYSTMQVRLLTKSLNNDPERYALLKKAYSRVTDQSNFKTLENLLSTQEWKAYFKLIIP